MKCQWGQCEIVAGIRLAMKRSFPYCSISDWTSLPADLLSQLPHGKGMHAILYK